VNTTLLTLPRAFISTITGPWFAWSLVSVATVFFFVWPYYRLSINLTDSVPFRVFIVDVSKRAPKVGEYVVFKWRGGAGYERGTQFVKRVEGVVDQNISVVGRAVLIDNKPVAHALERSPRGTLLEPIPAQRIASDTFYMSSDGKNAFDSRYAAFGLIHQNDIVGAAWPVF
jgi:conjugal transfer pilin signal peptidase TrbI